MSDTTLPALPDFRYADLDRLPGITGSSIQRQMATLRARLVARYKMHTVPGRPEELAQPTITVEHEGRIVREYSGRVVSLGYGCGTIRVRKHDGRQWIDHIDLQPNDGWHGQVYAFLDEFMGYVSDSPSALANKMAKELMSKIRDNPQA